MVKFGKNKFKALNKIAKSQKNVSKNSTNKILKKKLNSEKKVTFQKEVLLKQATAGGNSLVKKVSATEVILEELSKKIVKKKPKSVEDTRKPKPRPVEKQKKRQKTQINDTKLLLNLMKK